MVRRSHSLYTPRKSFTSFSCSRALDTTHIALTAHAIYFYLIVNFGNYFVLEAPIWYVYFCYFLVSVKYSASTGHYWCVCA